VGWIFRAFNPHAGVTLDVFLESYQKAIKIPRGDEIHDGGRKINFESWEKILCYSTEMYI
jgi:hypothetical protein